MKLGTWLAQSGLTQQTFGERVGCTESAVSRYVNGLRRPRLQIMRAIVRETKGAVTSDDFDALAEDEVDDPGHVVCVIRPAA
jgi:transcriptional regulator with XRE-family HTH domain